MSKHFHSADLATLENSIRRAWFQPGLAFPLASGLHCSACMKHVLPRTIHLSDFYEDQKQSNSLIDNQSLKFAATRSVTKLASGQQLPPFTDSDTTH
jgi:hypothetical protein